MYEYTATVLRVHDGASVDLSVDLGLDTRRRLGSVRLAGIEAPDLASEEGRTAREHLTFLLFSGGAQVTIRTHRVGEGYEATLYKGSIEVNRRMVEDGQAVAS